MNPITLLLILLFLPVVQASYLTEVKEKAIELETPQEIHWYLWTANIYEYHKIKKPLSIYWEDRIGDCTEVARIEYIMFKEIGLKARISHGRTPTGFSSELRSEEFPNGNKHDYVEYFEDGKWKHFQRNITRKGKGIW